MSLFTFDKDFIKKKKLIKVAMAGLASNGGGVILDLWILQKGFLFLCKNAVWVSGG